MEHLVPFYFNFDHAFLTMFLLLGFLPFIHLFMSLFSWLFLRIIFVFRLLPKSPFCAIFWEVFLFCFHHYAPFVFHPHSLLAVSFPALPWQEMQGEAEKSAELNRDAHLGQHNRLRGCVNVCVHESLGLLHRNAEKGKARETDTERKVSRCSYYYANCT